MDASRTNLRLLALIASPFALGITIAAVVAALVDSSTLANLPDTLKAHRDLSYGPGEHHALDLVRPREASGPRPAIVMIHPGGWMYGDKSAYHGLMVRYAELGYVTASVNFRPSGVAKFPAAVEDCRRAVRWLRTHAETYGLDPDRIGVTGFSSGAHLAMFLALSDEEGGRVQAAVCVSGVYNLLLQERGRFPNQPDDPAVVQFLGGSPLQNPELAKRASPVTYLTKDDPPLLVFHGEMDRRIDAEQARQLGKALRAIGREDEVVILGGAGHGLGLIPTSAESRERVLRFFERHLRPGGVR